MTVSLSTLVLSSKQPIGDQSDLNQFLETMTGHADEFEVENIRKLRGWGLFEVELTVSSNSTVYLNVKQRDRVGTRDNCAIDAKIPSNVEVSVSMKLLNATIVYFDALFGRLTTRSEIRKKHFFEVETSDFVHESYHGTDFYRADSERGIPGYEPDLLPGIYWRTYIGGEMLDKLDHQPAEVLEADRWEELHDGILLKPFDDPELICTETAEQKEREMMEALGKDAFFLRERIDPMDLV